jgi:hypothetical protein
MIENTKMDLKEIGFWCEDWIHLLCVRTSLLCKSRYVCQHYRLILKITYCMCEYMIAVLD